MKRILVLTMTTILGSMTALGNETLPPLQDGKAPQTVTELWAGYDPRQEPLEIEVLKEWEEDGVVLRVVRYRIGVFKGQRAMMAGVYGFPKGGTNLPGLVQIHGGGQSADYRACLTNAKRGYATISLAWAGRLQAPGYNVGGEEVMLFWEGKTSDPSYKVTTDWGSLDGYHAPRRYGGDFGSVEPGEHTIDSVESPRNCGWFLCTLGARRALTFLEQQPEVDGGRLGVYGHSMGAQITVYAAGTDTRVKAAAPSCGGVSYRNDGSLSISEELGWTNPPYLEQIACPIMFLSPANDFHGRIDDLQKAIREIRSPDWRVTSSAHHNHQDTAEYQVCGPLWFDQHLKGTFQFPETPAASLELKTATGVPSFAVIPDSANAVIAVDIYYTQQGRKAGEKDDMISTVNRFWHHANAKRDGNTWTAELPLLTTEKPLWVYANVRYPLGQPVTGAGYYYGVYTATNFNLSSPMSMASPEQLTAAGVKATAAPSLLIDDFAEDWHKEWFTYDLTDNWARKTHKLYDPMWLPPPLAKLALEVRCEQPNKLVVGLDSFAAEVPLAGGTNWQSVVLFPPDFRSAAGTSILDWKGIKELRLGATETLSSSIGGKDAVLTLGADWQGAKPEFRNLRWVPGTQAELNAKRTVKLATATRADGKTYLDIQYADVFTHGYKTAMNTTLDGNPLVVDGTTYEHGMATHAPSEAIFFLGGKFKTLHALAVSGAQASVGFQVIVDDKTVFDSGRLDGAKSLPVDVPLENVQEMRLIVTDGGNGKGGDHASWIDAWVK
jgi:hypothetical protein